MLGPVLRQDVLGSASTSKEAGLCLPTCQLCHRVLHPSYSPSSPPRVSWEPHRPLSSPGCSGCLPVPTSAHQAAGPRMGVHTGPGDSLQDGRVYGVSPSQVPPCPTSRQARMTGSDPGDKAASSRWLSPVLNRTQDSTSVRKVWEGELTS